MALREIIASFGINVDDSQLKKGDKSVGTFTKALETAGKAVTAAFVWDKASTTIREIGQMGDAILDTSVKLGTGAEGLQRLQYMAARSGASAEELNKGLLILSKNAAEGKIQIGDALIGTDGRDPADVFLDVGRAIAAMPDPMQRTAAAMKVFGKSGAGLVPIFSSGEAGLAEMSKRFDALGGAITDEELQKIGMLGDSTDDWDVALKKLKGTLGAKLLPLVSGFVDGASKGAKTLGQATDGTYALEAGIGVLSIAAGAAAVSMALPFVPFIAAAGVAMLVWEDFVGMLNGSKSVLGDFAAYVFGDSPQEAQTILHDVAAGWKELKADIEAARKEGKSAREIASEEIDKAAKKGQLAGVANAQAQLDQIERDGKIPIRMPGDGPGDIRYVAEDASGFSEERRKNIIQEERDFLLGERDVIDPKMRKMFASLASVNFSETRDQLTPIQQEEFNQTRFRQQAAGLATAGMPLGGLLSPQITAALSPQALGPPVQEVTITVDAKTTNQISANAETGAELGSSIALELGKANARSAEALKAALQGALPKAGV